ncbi:SCO6880 family protein [Nocardia niigatensis]
MTQPDTTERPLYAAGTYPMRTGFFGLNLRVSMYGGVALIVALIALMVGGLMPALLILTATALLLAPMVITFGRRTLIEVMQLRVQWWRRRWNGSIAYHSGPHSRIPGGRYRLPGLLAATALYQGTDLLGNEFGLVHRRRSDEYTVVLEAFPGGDEALTPRERDLMTADWGAYLARLGLPGDIHGASVVIETIPATGLRLAREVEQMVADSRSEVATQVMVESAAYFPAGKMRQLARMAITFKATTRERRVNPEEMADELARRLPALYEDLVNAGVEAIPMTAGQIVETVHRSYNPSSEPDFEELAILGEEHGLAWEDAGPRAALPGWDHYRHDGIRSIVWEMAEPPASVFPDEVLRPLLSPHDALPRKRVTLFYRPFSAGDASALVDKEYKDAVVAANQGKGIRSAASDLRVEYTQQQRYEQVRGAGLVRYSAMVTVATQGDLRAAAAIAESLAPRARLKLRRAYGEQDAAFAAALGIGVYLPDHSSTTSVAGNA